MLGFVMREGYVKARVPMESGCIPRALRIEQRIRKRMDHVVFCGVNDV